ncbi:MAG: endonuclease III [Deltaproteobacteria bacterium]|nr:endonuclease III [Deltaproteobacteria bacterium]
MVLLKKRYPDARCALNFKSPLELLVATILSAQCTDERVNKVTKNLFKKYKRVEDYTRAEPEILENDIRSTGFYKNKTKSIVKCCKKILENHERKVPSTMEELVHLGGVGRKTANVVLGNAFGIPGIAVDTHVKRIAHRLGLTNNQDPVKIEYDLMELVPRKEWTQFSHLIIFHGRNTCMARKPLCAECVLKKLCPQVDVKK